MKYTVILLAFAGLAVSTTFAVSNPQPLPQGVDAVDIAQLPVATQLFMKWCLFSAILLLGNGDQECLRQPSFGMRQLCQQTST